MQTYQWLNLQPGQLPLQPDGQIQSAVGHTCAITVIWPEAEKLLPSNSIIVDPCFSSSGYRSAKSELEKINATLSDIGFYFVTHDHYDHCLHFPNNEPGFSWENYPVTPDGGWPGLRLENCPGHHPELQALHFLSQSGAVWIVSDAILNMAWLKEWK